MSTGSLSTPPVSQTEGTGIDSYQAGNDLRYIALRSSAVKEDPTKLGYNEDSRPLRPNGAGADSDAARHQLALAVPQCCTHDMNYATET